MQATTESNLKLAKLHMMGVVVAFDAETDEQLFWVKVTEKSTIKNVERELAKRGYYTTQIRDNRIWI